MPHLKNCINVMPIYRCPRKVWQWDRITKTEAWTEEINFISNTIFLMTEFFFSKTIDLDASSSTLLWQSQNSWSVKGYIQPKLWTYYGIHDFTDTKAIINSNLSRQLRSIIVETGVLPWRIEMSGYKSLKEEERICDIGKTESEMHHHYRHTTL